MLYELQKENGHDSRWYTSLTQMARLRLNTAALTKKIHIISGNWLPTLSTGRLKTTMLSAVKHLISVLDTGSYDTVACLAKVKYEGETFTHCIALVLNGRNEMIVYDPNGANSSTNPLKDSTIAYQVGDFLSKRLNIDCFSILSSKSEKGIQARTKEKYGLCTVFAAYGLANILCDQKWNDTMYNPRDLEGWCELMADYVGANYWQVDLYSKKVMQRTVKYTYTHGWYTDGRFVKHTFKTRNGIDAWIKSLMQNPI